MGRPGRGRLRAMVISVGYRRPPGIGSRQPGRCLRRAASPYAAPARADDLSGLPAAYIASAEFCPNRDEAIVYGLRLLRAGVSVELHQWPGTFHGSQAILSAEVSQRQISELGTAVRRALAVRWASSDSQARRGSAAAAAAL